MGNRKAQLTPTHIALGFLAGGLIALLFTKRGKQVIVQTQNFIMAKMTRGVRNNNPGNIRINPNNKWLGKVTPSRDKAFETFSEYRYGVRAMIKLIQSDIRSGKNTITKLVKEYAPPNENDTNAYVNSVASKSGFTAHQPLIANKETIRKIVTAMSHHENGFEAINDKQFEDGYAIV